MRRGCRGNKKKPRQQQDTKIKRSENNIQSKIKKNC